jgi:hypothetical protein
MTGIFDRITALAGTETAKATNLAHETFQDRLATHHHVGRAMVETVAAICRNHPNLVGLGVGIVVERLLVEEKHRYDAHHPDGDLGGRVVDIQAKPGAKGPHLPASMVKLSKISPAKVGWDVFAGLIVLKFAATGVRFFQHKHQGESWFVHASRIRLFSGSIAAYQLAKALRSKKVSAWRNGAILFFGTDAMKPLLRPDGRVPMAPVRAQPQTVTPADVGQGRVLEPVTIGALAAAPTPAPPATHIPPAEEVVQTAPAPQPQQAANSYAPPPEELVRPGPQPMPTPAAVNWAAPPAYPAPQPEAPAQPAPSQITIN